MKKTVSAILSAAMLVTAITAAGFTAAEPTSISAAEAPNLTKEEFLDIVIAENSDLSDGGFIWRGDLKFDAIEENGRYDLIVYGIKQEDYNPGVNVSSEAVKYGSEIYSCSGSPAFYSGVFVDVESSDEKLPEELRNFSAVFYVNNVLPGYMNIPKTLVDASVDAPYDLAQYIYPEIIPGDADGDGTVDASDASQVLMAYAYRSVGKKLTLNDTIFDYNNDGTVDSNDASAILAFYSEQLTAAPDDVYVEYHFRTKELLEQHFQKHGSEFVGDFNYVTAVDYEKGASDVINNDTALFKTEAEDGDGVYYIENTNEFVILSTDGYIRTYFRPTAGINYFNKQ